MLFSPPAGGECATDGYRPAQDYILRPRALYAEVAVGSGTHHRLIGELSDLVAEAQETNWDGQQSAGINSEAHLAAWRFIQSLPAGIPNPSLGADPDGCVTFEWYVSPRKLVLISVHPDYRVDYAMIVGEAKSYGSEPFFGVLPGKITELVQRICKV